MVSISQALNSSFLWAAQRNCATVFQRRGVAHGRASGTDTPILDIWTKPDSKTSSAVLCLLWHPLQNKCDQPERAQKALDMWKNLLHKGRVEAVCV